MPFDHIKDFAPLSRVANVPNLVAHSSQPFKTVPKMMACAKANPGKINFGSPDNGASPHLSGELFKSMNQGRSDAHPLQGQRAGRGRPAGQPDFHHVRQHALGDSACAFGQAARHPHPTAKRSPELPDVPTIAEAGVQGYEAASCCGLFSPVATPARAKISAALGKVLAHPEVQKKIGAPGGETVNDTPEQFAAFIRAETTKWGNAVRESDATVDGYSGAVFALKKGAVSALWVSVSG